MINFVNAKINIGLQIVRRREDGYHDLQTVFYPVGIYAGTPVNPVSFCDILEINRTVTGDINKHEPVKFITSGRKVDCELEKNLVYKAARLYFNRYVNDDFSVEIRLDKFLPDGAGMGGGSADAAFTLKMLRAEHEKYLKSLGHEFETKLPTDIELASMALSLGADCPFFLLNRAAYACGVGEKLEPIDLDLSGKWLLIIKPVVSISTREAFAGITPMQPEFDVRRITELDIKDWKNFIKNDFETPFFHKYPEMKDVKEKFYHTGALYASLTGSGSCLYGIYESEDSGAAAEKVFKSFPTISATYLLKI